MQRNGYELEALARWPRAVYTTTNPKRERGKEPTSLALRVGVGDSAAARNHWAGDSGVLEEGQAGREAVDEVLAADGAKFSLGEETGHGNETGLGADDAGVVVGHGERPCAASIAAKQQGRSRRLLVGGAIHLQKRVQVLVRCLGVAHVELDRLSDTDAIGNGHRSRVPIQGDDVAD